MKKRYQIEEVLVKNDNEIDGGWEVNTYDTLEEAREIAEGYEHWRLREELRGKSDAWHYELWINHLEYKTDEQFSDGEYSVVEAEVISKIFRNFTLIIVDEEEIEKIENIVVYDLTDLDDYTRLKLEFSNQEEFDEFELMLEDNFINTDGHLYKVYLRGSIKWFDNAREALEEVRGSQ